MDRVFKYIWMPMRLVVTLFALFCSTAMSMETSSPQPRLIIIGASYAGSWQSPPFAGYAVTNKGIGGQDTSQVLERFDRDVIAPSPAATLIWGHINDMHRAPGGDLGAAAGKAKRNLAEMATRASRAGIRVIMATEITLSRPSGVIASLRGFIGKLRGKTDYAKRINDHVIEVNGFIRELAARNGYILLDLESALRGSDGYRSAEYDAEDGSHVNAAGYARLTRYALPRVPRP